MRRRAVVVSLLLVSMLVFAWVVAPSGSFSFVLRNPIVLVQNLFHATAAPHTPQPAGLTPTVPPTVPTLTLPPANTATSAPAPQPAAQPVISVPEVPAPTPSSIPGGTVPQPPTGVPGGVTPPGGVGGGPSGPPGVPDPKSVLPNLP